MPMNVQVPAAELKPPSASSAPSVGARGTRQDLARVRATHRRLDALQLPRGRGACRRALSIDSNGMGLGHGMLSIADSLSAALSGNFTYVPSITSLSIWADDPNFCGAPVTKLDSHGCMLSLQSHTGDPSPPPRVLLALLVSTHAMSRCAGKEASILCYMDLTSCRIDQYAEFNSVPANVRTVTIFTLLAIYSEALLDRSSPCAPKRALFDPATAARAAQFADSLAPRARAKFKRANQLYEWSPTTAGFSAGCSTKFGVNCWCRADFGAVT